MASSKEEVVDMKPGTEKHLRTEASSVSSNGDHESEKSGKKTFVDKCVVIARNETGVVKWFSFKNGYGFATVDSSGKDIFIHRSEFVSPTRREIFYIVDEGDKLEFDIVQRSKGLEAVAVTGPGGKRIPGAPMGLNRFVNKKQNGSFPSKPVESDGAVSKSDMEKKKRHQVKIIKDDDGKKTGKTLPKNGLEGKEEGEKSTKPKPPRTHTTSAQKVPDRKEVRSNEWGGAKQAENAQRVSSSADEKELDDVVQPKTKD